MVRDNWMIVRSQEDSELPCNSGKLDNGQHLGTIGCFAEHVDQEKTPAFLEIYLEEQLI